LTHLRTSKPQQLFKSIREQVVCVVRVAMCVAMCVVRVAMCVVRVAMCVAVMPLVVRQVTVL